MSPFSRAPPFAASGGAPEQLPRLLASARQRWDAMDTQQRASAALLGAVALFALPKASLPARAAPLNASVRLVTKINLQWQA